MGPPAQLLLLLLLLQSPENTVSQTSSAPLIVNGFLGESVTLPLKLPAGEKIYSITWLHNGTSIVVIDPNDARILVTARKWKDALNVTQSYSLQLSNLTMADIGSYRAMIATETSSVFSSYTLRIFKRLPRPYIRVDSVISENGMCHATLRCSVEEGGENVTYEWTSMGQGAVVSKKGSILNDSWSLGDLDWTYTCTAMNTVSNSISNLIHAGQLCAGCH
nr:PREDICTED: SLAM family member 6-like isoform X2 [Equus przewalskii]